MTEFSMRALAGGAVALAASTTVDGGIGLRGNSKRSRQRCGNCWVTADDGTTLFVRDVGGGQPIVFLHSWTLASAMWQYQTAALAALGYRCVSFDRRGHGRSDEPSSGYDIDTLVDDVECVIEALDLRDVTLVGHSFGCVEAVHCAARPGSRVARLSLLSATTPFLRKTDDNPLGIDDAAFEFLRAVWRRDFAAWMDENTAPFFTPDTSPGIVRWLTDMMLRTPLEVAIACNETMVATDSRDALRSLRIPVLVVHGDCDASAPLALTGEPTAALLPHAVFKVYEGAPHGLFVTHMDRLNADLVEFLATA